MPSLCYSCYCYHRFLEVKSILLTSDSRCKVSCSSAAGAHVSIDRTLLMLLLYIYFYTDSRKVSQFL